MDLDGAAAGVEDVSIEVAIERGGVRGIAAVAEIAAVMVAGVGA
jgi:hypothetical protein